MTQRDDDGLRTDAEISSLWARYLETLIEIDACQTRAHSLGRDLETRYLKLDREAERVGAKWNDLEARFLELQRDAQGLHAHWSSVGSKQGAESWILNGRRKISGLFEPCATLAALRLVRRAGGDPKFFFWIDRLNKAQVEGKGIAAAPRGIRSAVLFWLDRLKDDSLNYKAQSATRGTIHQVCQASADYCGRLSRGYMPTIHFLGLAQGEHGNEQRDSRSIPANGQRKPTRGMSQLTRALVMGLIQRPEANGAWLSQWLDEQGVLPTPKMVKSDRRSFEDAYGDPSLKHGLEVLFSRIRRRMARNRAL